MRELHEEQGGVFGTSFDVEVVRHYGDPAAEYRAAVEETAIVDRSHRTRLRLTGRMPAQVIQGVVTGTIPDRPTSENDHWIGRWEYSLVLTPKGRIVSDLRLSRSPDEGEEFFLDIPAAGIDALREHVKKYVPPRLASLEDVSEETGMLSLLGPGAVEHLTEVFSVGAAELEALEEGDVIRLGSDGIGLQVIRAEDLHTPQFDVVGGRDRIRELWTAWVEAGVRPAGRGVFQTLRIEAGRPAFGQDMTEETLPPEAGVVERAVDHFKGCYTGQEVIVRIRDRGHVNRHLRGFLLEDGASPAPDTEIYLPDEEKSVGWITSVADSPRAGRPVALGFLRRELELPAEVRVGSPEGGAATARESSPGWYG